MKKVKCKLKRVGAFLIIFLLCFNNFAAIVSDNDGSAFITKAEFDSLKNSFQAQINVYNTNIDSKIDEAIASYLAGITVTLKENLKNYYKENDGNNINWRVVDIYRAMSSNGSYSWSDSFKRPFFFAQWFTGAGVNYAYGGDVTGNGAGSFGCNYLIESNMVYNIMWDCAEKANGWEVTNIAYSGLRVSCNLNSANIKTWTRTDNLLKLNSKGDGFVAPSLTGATWSDGDSSVYGNQTFQLYRKYNYNLKNVCMVNLSFNGTACKLTDTNLRMHDITKDGIATNGSSTNASMTRNGSAASPIYGYKLYTQNSSIAINNLYQINQGPFKDYGKVGYGRILTKATNDGKLTFNIKKTAGTYNFWKIAVYDEDNVKQSFGTIEDGLNFTYDNSNTQVKSAVFSDTNTHTIKVPVKKGKYILVKIYPCTDSSGTLASTHGNYVRCSVEDDIILEIER